MTQVFPPLVDLHQDLLLHINRRDLYPDHWQTDFDMLVRTNTKVVLATAFPVPENEEYLNPITNRMIEEDFRTYNSYCKTSTHHSIIRTSDDLRLALKKDASTGIILHIEGLNAMTDGDWDICERWFDLGWRSLGIVWNVTNSLGGGTKDPSTGLTDLGAKLITWCEKKGMIVDFAHMNAPTFAQAAKIVNRPLLVSHGNACALCENPRNYSDEQLRLIAQTNGVIGVFFARTYVTGTSVAEISDVANHIDHLVRVMGIDHVALGTDFGGIITGHVSQLDSLETLPLFWQELEKRGYTSDQIEKISWKNAARVLECHLTPVSSLG
ncbi:membrane dipeptidase [Candidatus Uhrbacteria bacterium]|nr:membrane dipeptidase [Candidatus Uhrbacteria bacterium]